MKKCIIGIDVGTASIKGLLVDMSGTIVATDSSSIRMSTPRPGWAEQNPEDWWSAAVQVLDTLTVDRNLEVVAVSVSGQMHSLVPLDAAGDVVRPAILWCDQRTQQECVELSEACGGEQEVTRTFGNPILPGFTAPELLWLRINETLNFARIARFCLPKDYIVLKLTGRLVTEPSDASGTSLYRVREGVWDNHILDVLEVQRSMLPDLVGVGSVVGAIAFPDLPRLRGVPVVAGGSDNAAAAFGCGVEKPGDTVVSLGTGGTVVAVTTTPNPDLTGRVHLFSHVTRSCYYHMAVILSAAGSLDWFRQRFAQNLSYGRIEEMVGQSPVGSNGVLFLPYLNGDRTPHRDPDARGVLYGMSSFNTQGDILRAVHEGVVFALREGAESIADMGTPMTNVRVVGGGSRSHVWCQMLADNLGTPVWSPLVDEGAAYGSARLAANATGIDTTGWVKLVERYVPDEERGRQYAPWFAEYRELYQALRERFKAAARLVERQG
ncbi:MAG: xylulokinase [Candidatus Cryosericum sp.]